MDKDIALLLAVAILTVSLSAVGVEMANYPPTTSKAKWTYRVIFIVIGILLIGAFFWQGIRNIAEQTSIRSEAREETKAIQTQYDQMTGRLKSIQQTVDDPPQGLTKDQVAEVVKAQVTEALRTVITTRNPTAGPVAAAYSPPVLSPPPPSKRSTDALTLQALQREAFGLVRQIDDWICVNFTDVPNVPPTTRSVISPARRCR